MSERPPDLSMPQDRLRAFLGRPIIAVLAWTTPSGEPMATPVWYERDADRFLIYTTYGAAKSRALRRNPGVCLCVQYPTPPHRYVTVRGTARIMRDRDLAVRLRDRLARRYLGRLGARQFIRMATEAPGEPVVLEVTPVQLTSLDTASVINPLVLAAWNMLRKVPGL